MLKVVGASWMQTRMSTWIIGVVLVFGIVVIILGQINHTEEDGNYAATAYWNKETGFEIRFWGQGMDKEKIPKGAARVYFQPHIDTTGWAIIDILTQSEYPDWVQAYAAGMLEGSLTWQLIYWQWRNTIQHTCENREVFCNYVRKYLEENFKSIKKNYQSPEDPFWYQVYLFYIQLEGIQQGFEHGVKRSRQTVEELKFVDFLWLNAASDIVDLEYKFYDTKPYASVTLNESDTQNFVSDSILVKKLRNLRSVNGYSVGNQPVNFDETRPQLGCGVTLGSAFVKLVPETGQLVIGHNSAGPYVSMLKMMKHYHLKYHWSASNFWRVDKKLTFSSYPGAIHSVDDFYVVWIDPKTVDFVVVGTPITVFSKSLWHHVSPWRQVLSGPRAIVSSRLSRNASAWTEMMSKYNSGTGNKEWAILDVEKFMNISDLRDEDEEKYLEALRNARDILWVAEQIPGLFIKEDQTEIMVTKNYWASYGLSFYKNISDLIEVGEMEKKYGDAFSYERTPLAKIYKRDQENATTLWSVMNLMRSNAFMKDPLSLGNPRCAIGARGDIRTKNANSFPIGVTDSKVFSAGEDPVQLSPNNTHKTDLAEEEEVLEEEEEKFKLLVVAGPAYTSQTASDEAKKKEDIKPFDWVQSGFEDFPHNGHPEVWDFKPIEIS